MKRRKENEKIQRNIIYDYFNKWIYTVLILPVHLFINEIFEIIISVEPFSAVGLTTGILKVIFCELGFLIAPIAALIDN